MLFQGSQRSKSLTQGMRGEGELGFIENTIGGFDFEDFPMVLNETLDKVFTIQKSSYSLSHIISDLQLNYHMLWCQQYEDFTGDDFIMLLSLCNY